MLSLENDLLISWPNLCLAFVTKHFLTYFGNESLIRDAGSKYSLFYELLLLPTDGLFIVVCACRVLRSRMSLLRLMSKFGSVLSSSTSMVLGLTLKPLIF